MCCPRTSVIVHTAAEPRMQSAHAYSSSPPPSTSPDVLHNIVLFCYKLKFRVARRWHAKLIFQTSPIYKPLSKAFAPIKMATTKHTYFSTSCRLITFSLYNTSCKSTYFHIRSDFVYLKDLLYLYTRQQRKFLRFPHTLVTQERQTQRPQPPRAWKSIVFGVYTK